MDWNACYNVPTWTLGWIECHPGLAGYLQAGGTVLAIGFGAGMVVWQQSRVRTLARAAAEKSEQEKSAKRNALAYRLDLLVDDIRSHYDLVNRSHELFEGGLSLINEGPSRLDDAIKAMTINVSWSDNIFDEMWVMPREVQESVITLLYLVANYNRETEQTLHHGSKHGVRMILDLPEDERKMLHQIEYRLNEANRFLEAMLPPAVR